ncbi:MAG: hypothetical protein ACM3MK_11915 [Chitinophagales bacterium]
MLNLKVLLWLKKLFLRLIVYLVQQELYISGVRLSSDGKFVDLRYRLVKPSRRKRPIAYLIDDDTGERIALMRSIRYGMLPNWYNQDQETGLLIFRNNGSIKAGSKITLVFGPNRVNHIKIAEKSQFEVNLKNTER